MYLPGNSNKISQYENKVTQSRKNPAVIYSSIKEDNQFAQTNAALASRRLAERKQVSVSVDRNEEQALRKQQRNTETLRDKTKGLRGTERESLAWIWMVSGLKSRGYLCLYYKFACSWSQRPEPGSRDTCCTEKSAEQPQREFYRLHKFSAPLTEKWNNGQRCGIFIVLLYPTTRKREEESCEGQLHLMITHKANPLQRSEVSTVTDLLTGCNDVNRNTFQDKAISIFKPISPGSVMFVFVESDHICLTCIL